MISAGRGLDRRTAIGLAVALPATAGAAPAGSSPPLQARSTVLDSGEHRVTSNLTIKGDLLLMPGAAIRIAEGCVLTLLGDLQAPASHIFRGQGRVDLTRSRLGSARPEWWGAIPDDPEIDCAPAVEASLAAHHDIAFGSGSYFVSRTVRVVVSNRHIHGVGRARPELDRTTRLVLTAAQGDVLFVGHAQRPPRIIDFVEGVRIRDLHLLRARSAMDAAAPDHADAPAGLRVRYVLNSVFEDLLAENQPIGFSVGGTARTFVRDCTAIMRNDLPGARQAQFWGFHFHGDVDIGLSGGNASLYVEDCHVHTTYGEPSPRSVGAYCSGAFADLYLIGFAAAEIARGIMVTGLLRSTSPAARRAGNADLQIIMPILDQCRQIALDIRDTSDHALIDVVSPYAALAAGAAAAINLERSNGQVSISGGQLIGIYNLAAGGSGIGLCGVSADGFDVGGLKLQGFPRPILLSRCSDFDVAASVSNPAGGAEAAAIVEDCRTGSLRIRVKGRRRSFGAGVRLSAGSSLMIETAGIDPDALEGGAAARVMRDGKPLETGAVVRGITIVGPIM